MYIKCILIMNSISSTMRFIVTFSNIHINDPSLHSFPNPGQALLLMGGGSHTPAPPADTQGDAFNGRVYCFLLTCTHEQEIYLFFARPFCTAFYPQDVIVCKGLGK